MSLDIDGVGERCAWRRKRAGRRSRISSSASAASMAAIQHQHPFCREVGLDYVSCSPFRVPIARLAAALSGGAERQKIARFAARWRLSPCRSPASVVTPR